MFYFVVLTASRSALLGAFSTVALATLAISALALVFALTRALALTTLALTTLALAFATVALATMSAAGSAGHSRVIRSTTHDKAGIGSQTVLDHSVHTIAGEGGTCNAVYLQFVLGGTALHHSKVDRLATGLCKERASVEQFLEAALADACTQTSLS